MNIKGEIDFNKSWIVLDKTENQILKMLIEDFMKLPLGEKLIKEVYEFQKVKSVDQILPLFAIGDVSFLDLSVVRKFNPKNYSEIYSIEQKLYLNKNLSRYDVLMDLAHELTHLLRKQNYNPYLQKKSVKDFLYNSLDGPGGEVSAFYEECLYSEEIFQKYKFGPNERCRKYFHNGKYDKDKILQAFFSVGEQDEVIYRGLSSLDKDYIKGKISDAKPEFISSLWKLPYPLALIQEYQEINKNICFNNRKRLTLHQEELANLEKKNRSSNRNPTSIHDPRLLNQNLLKTHILQLKEQIHKFCE